MLAFVIVLQVVVALFLIMVVLLQPGNRGGASAALGGAGSDTVFGARGANTFLSKITFGAAVCFMVTNLSLSYMSSSSQKSVLDILPRAAPKEAKPAEEPAPGGEPPQEQPAPPTDGAPKEEGALGTEQQEQQEAAPVGQEAAPANEAQDKPADSE